MGCNKQMFSFLINLQIILLINPFILKMNEN